MGVDQLSGGSGGDPAEWTVDANGNLVPIDGEPVGDGTTTAEYQSVDVAEGVVVGDNRRNAVRGDSFILDDQQTKAYAIGANNSLVYLQCISSRFHAFVALRSGGASVNISAEFDLNGFGSSSGQAAHNIYGSGGDLIVENNSTSNGQQYRMIALGDAEWLL